MAPEDDDDLYNEEFDFVDDEEDEVDEESDIADADADEEAADDRGRDDADGDADRDADDERVDEYGRPEPKPDYVVHIYEYQKFKRTIDRPFRPEDAEAFATEYNRTAKPYGRFAVAGKNDAKPKKTLD